MTRLLAVIIIAALASGCVYHHRWTKPGATAQDFYQNKLRSGVGAGGFLPDGTTTSEPSRAKERDNVERCLRALGWQDMGRVSWRGGSDEEYAGARN